MRQGAASRTSRPGGEDACERRAPLATSKGHTTEEKACLQIKVATELCHQLLERLFIAASHRHLEVLRCANKDVGDLAARIKRGIRASAAFFQQRKAAWHEPGCERVLLFCKIEERMQRPLQDVVAGVLRLARDVAHHERKRQKDSHAWHGKQEGVNERGTQQLGLVT